MRRSPRIAAFFLLLSAAGGCLFSGATVGLSDVRYKAAEKTKPDDIPMYRSQKPGRPWDEIATARAFGMDPEELQQAAREAAAELGGHAIIDMEYGVGGVVFTVIRYK